MNNPNKSLSTWLRKKVKIEKIPSLYLCGVLNLKQTAVSELLAGRSQWMLHHVVNISIYFDIPIEMMIGKINKKKEKAQQEKRVLQKLSDGKHNTTLGRYVWENNYKNKWAK